jgi:hypothetical protein
MVVELEPDRPTMYWTFDDLGLAEQAGYEGEIWLDEPRITDYVITDAEIRFDWERDPDLNDQQPVSLRRSATGWYSCVDKCTDQGKKIECSYQGLRTDTQTHSVLTGRWTQPGLGRGVFIASFPRKAALRR